MINIKMAIVVAAVYFLLLYLIALIASWNYKWEKDEFHFLGISDTQWGAVFVLWLPIIIGIFSLAAE